MRFDRLHRRVSYLLIITALLLLTLSGELSLPAWLLAFGALPFAYRRWLRPIRGKRLTWVWNVGLMTVLLLLLAAAVLTGNWLLHMVHFGIVMTVAKLFWIGRARDVLQLYALSFLLVVGGAVVNPGLSFASLFLVYVVLLTWALILLHLRREMETHAAQESAIARGESTTGRDLEASHEQAREAVDWRAGDLVSRRFLLGTSALAVSIFLSSLVIFFLFPRLGLGFFNAKTRNGQSVSGFGGDIELGHFGTIRDNMAVVMRVELPDEPPSPSRTLRIRGISFDTYDGRGWRKNDKGGQVLAAAPGGYYDAAPDLPWVNRGSLLRQDIYLEPIDTGRPVLFGSPRIRYVRRPSAKLRDLAERASGGSQGRLRFLRDRAGDISYQGRNKAMAFRYTILSDTRFERPPNDGEGEIPEEIRERYLQLPEGFDPRVPALAEELTRGATNPADRAQALETRLQSDWNYTLEGGHDPADPLGDFLFGRKEGHCEYFATSMALMARSLGLPARTVNGFYGGEWNEFGAYYAMRQADAHSWVEVWFPEYGWRTYDPTPAQERSVGARSGLLAQIDAWIDSLQLQWYKWVIEYDLSKQLDFLRGVFDVFSSSGSPFGDFGKSLNTRRFKEFLKGLATPTPILVLGGLVVGLIVFRVVRKRRRAPKKAARTPRPRTAREALQLWQQVERRLARRGFPRPASQSPRDWAASLTGEGHPRAELLAAGATALYEVLWGGFPLDARRKDALAQAGDAARD